MSPNVAPAPRYLEAWDRSTSPGVTAESMAAAGGWWIGPTLRLGEPFGSKAPEEIVQCRLAQQMNPDVKILLTCRFDLVGPQAIPALGPALSFQTDWIASVPWPAQRDGLVLMANAKNGGLPLRERTSYAIDWAWMGKHLQALRPVDRYPCFEYTGYERPTNPELTQNHLFARTSVPAFRAWARTQIVCAFTILQADALYFSANLNMTTNPQGKTPPYPSHGMITSSPYAPGEAVAGMAAMVDELAGHGCPVAIKTIGYAGMGENLWSLYPQTMQDQLIAEINFLRP